MLSYLHWDPAREMFSFRIPLIDRPILWYGFFFAFGFFLAYGVLKSLLKHYFLSNPHLSKQEVKKRVVSVSEKIALYVIVGAIVGARLGDVVFYQKWSDYTRDPLSILRVWEGGLASHGGTVGILVALLLLAYQLKRDYPSLRWLNLSDLLVIPTALAGGCIRIGNFFNQEVLGKQTDFPWGVIFGHPVDGGPIVPRHPAQLYEAIFYFIVFIVLWCLWKWVPKIHKRGKITGLFFVCVFSFRFFIEFLKEEQSALITGPSLLNMGQYLSIPFIILGFVLLFVKRRV